MIALFCCLWHQERQRLHALKQRTGQKSGPVIALWQAVITSPSGQEESPHGVYQPTRDSLLGQPVFTAWVPFSSGPPSHSACYPCHLSVSREAPTPDAHLIPPRGEGLRFIDATVSSKFY